jgi:hypothetical protein
MSRARTGISTTLIVSVPRSLSVSEAHGIKPRADIVWREDPPGDRYVQVEGIMRDALTPTLSTMQGEVPVQVVIEVTRFHALSERRATPSAASMRSSSSIPSATRRPARSCRRRNPST